MHWSDVKITSWFQVYGRFFTNPTEKIMILMGLPCQIRGASVEDFIVQAQDRQKNAYAKSMAAAYESWGDEITYESQRIMPLGWDCQPMVLDMRLWISWATGCQAVVSNHLECHMYLFFCLLVPFNMDISTLKWILFCGLKWMVFCGH